MMRMINEQSVLRDVLYVSNLDVNLLSEKKLCVNDLKESFDKNELYLHNNKGRQVLRASNRRRLYIVNKISPQLNKYALIASTIFKIIVMSTLIETIDDEIIINLSRLNNNQIISSDNLLNRASKLKIYKL